MVGLASGNEQRMLASLLKFQGVDVDLWRRERGDGFQDDYFHSWETCLSLERLHLVDNEPIALGRSFLPTALATLSRNEMESRPTYAIVSAVAGLDVERAHVAIGAETADPQLGAILKVPAGAALLVMERTSWFTDDTPAERSTFYVRPERYRFVMNSLFRP